MHVPRNSDLVGLGVLSRTSVLFLEGLGDSDVQPLTTGLKVKFHLLALENLVSS